MLQICAVIEKIKLLVKNNINPFIQENFKVLLSSDNNSCTTYLQTKSDDEAELSHIKCSLSFFFYSVMDYLPLISQPL